MLASQACLYDPLTLTEAASSSRELANNSVLGGSGVIGRSGVLSGRSVLLRGGFQGRIGPLLLRDGKRQRDDDQHHGDEVDLPRGGASRDRSS